MSAYQSFPSSIPVMLNGEATPVFKTISNEFENGVRQTRSAWGRCRREYTVPLSALTNSQRSTLWDFFNGRKGGADAFLFDDPWAASVVGEAVGTGNGTTTVFALANKYVQSATFKVYLAGVEQTSGFTLQGDAGTVTFSTAPGAGVAIAADYRASVLVRFKVDRLPFKDLGAKTAFSVDVELEEVLL